MVTIKKKLGEMLVEEGLIDNLQLNSALGHQRQWGGHLGSIFVEMGFVDEKDIAAALERQLGIRCINIDDFDVSEAAIEAMKVDIAKKYMAFPLMLEDKTLTLAMTNPAELNVIDELQFMLGYRIKPVLALESDIKRAIAYHYEGVERPKQRIDRKSVQEVEIKPTEFKQEQETLRQEEPKREITQKMVIEALISLLVEKGIITKDEMLNRLHDRTG